MNWPLDSNTTLKFTNWALTKKELSHTTVKAYLHDISLLHKLKEVCCTIKVYRGYKRTVAAKRRRKGCYEEY